MRRFETISKISILLILSVAVISSCNPNAGLRGVSNDIAMSKRLGVFVCEYEARPNPYYINDTICFTVKEAYLETFWGQTSGFKAVPRPDNGYQLIIETEENMMKKYPRMTRDWTIGIDWEKNIRFAGTHSMMGDFKNLPQAEREVWKVMKGDKFNDSVKTIIGEFVLYKK